MNKGGKCERRDDEGSKKRDEGDFLSVSAKVS